MDASQLARELAQDKRFRRKLLSALTHGSAARARAQAGFGSAAARLVSDRKLLSELRAAREDLQRAYGRARSKKRRRRFRKLFLFAALASLLGLPQLRQRLTGLVGRARSAPAPTSRLEDLTKDELYARAQEAEIPGRSEMSKDQLISALRAKS